MNPINPMNNQSRIPHRAMPDSTIKTSIRVPLCRCFAGVALLLLLALAPAAWGINVSVTYDGSGNLSTNISGAATNPLMFYILK